MDDLIPMIRQLPQRVQDTEDGQVIISHTIAHAGGDASSTNIIPTEAFRCWSIRTGTDKQQEKIENEMKDIFKHMLKDRVLGYDFNYQRECPALVNDANLIKKIATLIEKDAYTEHPRIMGGEDFAFISREVPAAYWALGTGGIPGKTDIPFHKPNFDVDESVLWKGVMFWIMLAKELII